MASSDVVRDDSELVPLLASAQYGQLMRMLSLYRTTQITRLVSFLVLTYFILHKYERVQTVIKLDV